MKQWMPGLWICLCLLLFGCPKRNEPPQSAYDPKVLETADQIRQLQDERQKALSEQSKVKPKAKGECSRKTGGCKEGFLCYDSWFCKDGFTDQCSEAGDKQCHKICKDEGDCPEEMPVCKDVPIFNGNEQGVLQKMCMGE